MVTTSQNPEIDMQKLKSKEPKYITKESQQTMREENENKRTENYKNNHKASNKMAVNTYFSIITSNVNGQNAPIKRHRETE